MWVGTTEWGNGTLLLEDDQALTPGSQEGFFCWRTGIPVNRRPGENSQKKKGTSRNWEQENPSGEGERDLPQSRASPIRGEARLLSGLKKGEDCQSKAGTVEKGAVFPCTLFREEGIKISLGTTFERSSKPEAVEIGSKLPL